MTRPLLHTPPRLAALLPALLTWLAAGLGAAFAQSQAAQPHLIDSAGDTRRYTLDLPAVPAGAPLIVAFHDSASSGAALRATTGLSDAATSAGFAVAYPDSLALSWKGGRSGPGDNPDVARGDELAMLRTLVADATERYGTSPAGVTLVGLGAGAALAFELACEAADLVERVAAVAGLMWEHQREGCRGSDATLSLLVLHGTEDARYPPLGQQLEGSDPPLRSLGAGETLAFWADRLACERDASAPGVGLVVFGGCRGGAELALIAVRGAGHHWFRQGRVLNPTTLDTAAIVVAFAAGGDWRALVPERVAYTGDGPPRTFFVYAPPSYDPTRPTPVVLVLHGRPGNGPGMAFITDMSAVADQAGFLAIYPEAAGDSWNYVEGLPGFDGVRLEGDLDFIRALPAELQSDFNLDERRLYVSGFSNGGFMTQRLACEVSDQYAAFAFLGATFVPETAAACARAPTAPMLYMHGTDDVSIPWQGMLEPAADDRTHIAGFSALETIRYWATRNGCTYLPIRQELPQGSPDTKVVRLIYDLCTSGHPLVTYIVEGGGHNWPGVPGRIGERIAGRVNMDMNAGMEIWRFFLAYPLEAGRGAR